MRRVAYALYILLVTLIVLFTAIFTRSETDYSEHVFPYTYGLGPISSIEILVIGSLFALAGTRAFHVGKYAKHIGAYALAITVGAMVGLGSDNGTLREIVGECRYMVYLIPAYLLTVNLVQTQNAATKLVRYVAVLVTIKSLIAIYRYVNDIGYVYGPFVRVYVDTADFTLLVCFLGSAVYAFLNNQKWTVAAVLSTTLVTAAIIVTYSRAAWAAAAFTVVALAAVSRWSHRIVVSIGVVILLVVLGQATNVSEPLSARLAGTLDPDQDSTTSYRLTEYSLAMAAVSERIVVGRGFRGGFADKGVVDARTDTRLVHNNIIWVWLKMGILGVFAYIWLLGGALIDSSRALVRLRARVWSGRPIAAAAAFLIAYSVVSMVGNLLGHVRDNILLGVSLGLCSVCVSTDVVMGAHGSSWQRTSVRKRPIG